jgi:hypothetical protein
LSCGTMTQRTLKKVTTVDWKYSQINVSSKWRYYSSSSSTLSHRSTPRYWQVFHVPCACNFQSKGRSIGGASHTIWFWGLNSCIV